MERMRFTVRGVVQGVGFRPFVYALAADLALAGHVANTGDGVVGEVEGTPAALARFRTRIATDAPPLAVVESVRTERVPARGGTGFTIRESARGPARTLVSPDVATCDACLAELRDPTDRRFRHPFITCTHCGPRFTIVTGLPYDRAATTMVRFPLCDACAAEYADPTDRRFHAQPIACPDCGPTLRLVRPGRRDAVGEDALAACRAMLAEGAVVAVKGLGGYHLACDATDETAVRALRKRKDRGDKPFAVLAADLDTARGLAEIDADAAELLTGPRRPIVLAHTLGRLAPAVAPGGPDLGVMLPYTPVHHLLLESPGPLVLVCTSGNLSGEPIVTDDAQAFDRLAALADAWLCHDRPIHVPCDDSVVRVVAGAELPYRRSRGYAPFPVPLATPVRPALAVGGDVKNTFCVADGRYAWLSGHVGDMNDVATLTAFDAARAHLERLTGVAPEVLVTDAHPRYQSRAWADRNAAGRPVLRVQHHHAHVASAMAEHGHDGTTPVLGVAFDGTGYGDDGAVWGGEFLLCDYDSYRRVGHLAYVPLPGGDAAVRNPYRMALSHLRAAELDWTGDLPCVAAAGPADLALLSRILDTGTGCVPTSSMGRLYDAVASLAGVRHRVGYEAQAAIELEGAARVGTDDGRYRFALDGGIADAAPVLAAVVDDLRLGTAVSRIAARFHGAVVALVADVATAVRADTGVETVALSGGVFCNELLTTGCADALAARGFRVLRHRRVPPNDAGLALGQLVVAARLAGHQDKEATRCV